MVDRGERAFREDLSCLLLGQSSSYWGLALNPGDWSGVYMLDADYAARRADPFWRCVADHFKEKLFLVPSIDMVLGRGLILVVLLEGDPDFLCNQLVAVPSDWAALLLLPAGWTRPILPSVQWLTVTHRQCGGITSARVNIGRRNVPPLHFKLTVRRSISSILVHSTRPDPCTEEGPSTPHYVGASSLHTWALDRPVLLPTTFYKTGWGIRCLTDPELGSAFDLPLWIDPTSTSFGWWRSHLLSPRTVPVKIPSAILEAALPHLLPVLVHTTCERSCVKRDPAPLSPPTPKRGRWMPLSMEATHGGVLGTWLPTIRAFLPHAAWLDESLIGAQATKSDDAVTPFWLWDKRIQGIFPWVTARALDGFRLLALLWWRRSLFRSFLAYLRSRFGTHWQDLLSTASRSQGGDSFSLSCVRTAGCSVLSQLLSASWWEWDNGSSLVFWRWNGLEQQRNAFFGQPIRVAGSLPTNQRPQRPPSADSVERVAAKIAKVIHRGYFDQGAPIESLTDFFDVPKGDSDIRMVYNGTSSGLNDALWAPNFWLPTAESSLRLLTTDSYCGDMDLGEMFLNFPMDIHLRPYAGVDVRSISSFFPENLLSSASGGKIRWNRLFMGMLPSPYHSVEQFYLAEEIAIGSPSEPDNPCGFDEVRFNIPGSSDYNPILPWVMKWNAKHNNIAGDAITYMDDIRTVGFSAENAWQVARRLASRLQYMGIQDAPRKRRPPSKTPGAWAGSVQHISEDAVSKTVTQAKWDKGRSLIAPYIVSFEENPKTLPSFLHKQMQRDVGFFVHLALTFSSMMPFLKGFYLTMNNWRGGRNDEGWKLSAREWISQLQVKMAEQEVDTLCGLLEEEDDPTTTDQSTTTKINPSKPPKLIQAVPRLRTDVLALSAMLEPATPPIIKVRSKSVFLALYGAGDASGAGFGSAILLPQKGLSYRIGVWRHDVVVGESSNWKEFTNCVEAMEEEAEKGNLSASELFFFTDNSTVERCFYKGSSLSEKLLNLIIRLRRLEMRYALRLHISHVSGKRMIAWGVDGISRGQLNEGVMAGKPMLSFIPLHKTPMQMSSTLFEWVKSWLGPKTELLTPMDWFTTGHDIRGWTLPTSYNKLSLPILRPGHFVWNPPPGAAEVAIEQLRKARHKRQKSTHVFLCQRLLTPRWYKQLHKACDLVIEIPAVTRFWPKEKFEPLIVGFAFPFLRSKPWQLRGTPKVFAVERALRKLWPEDEVAGRNFLRKFLIQAWKMGTMSEVMVSRVLFFERRHQFLHREQVYPNRRKRRR